MHHVQAAVDRLLAQYREYVLLDAAANDARKEFEAHVFAIARKKNIELATAMKDESVKEAAQRLNTMIKMHDRVADEMTFATPEIWMRYKALAYAGTEKDLSTWQNFRAHCMPKGYICTKRFAFLRRAAQVHGNIDLDAIDESTRTLDICEAEWFQKLMQNPHVLADWQSHEFFIKHDRVAKWEDV